MNHGVADDSDVLDEVARLLRRAADLLERASGARPAASAAGGSDAAPRAGLPPLDERATTRQVGAIFGIARKRGLGRDEVLALVRGRTGRDRVEYLTRGQASAVIAELEGTNGSHA